MTRKAHACDAMAGAGGAAGPAQDVRHQPQGDVLPANRYTNTMHKHESASTLVVQRLAQLDGMHEIVSSIPSIIHNFENCFVKENMAYRAIDIVYRCIYCYLLLYADINCKYRYIHAIYHNIHDIYHEHHGISRLILMLWYMHCISLGNFNVER